MKTGRAGNARQELVGPMQRITISSGPRGKLVSKKRGVSELEVDNIMFCCGRETHLV